MRYIALWLILILPGCQQTRLQVVCKNLVYEISVTYEGGGTAVEAE